jgi:hypothetical protein
MTNLRTESTKTEPDGLIASTPIFPIQHEAKSHCGPLRKYLGAEKPYTITHKELMYFKEELGARPGQKGEK